MTLAFILYCMATMLTVINLFVIDRIFEEAESKLKSTSRMLYINCLMHHFREKPANAAGAVAFEIFNTDFPELEKYRAPLQELHKAKLISIEKNHVAFHNKWGKFIDRTKLEKVSPDEYLAGFQFNGIEIFKEDLRNSYKLVELCERKYKANKLSKGQIGKLVELFVLEQETTEKKYHSFSDCMLHCVSWIGKNTDKVPQESIKTTGKLLGQ